jgi:hypothetical protein
VAMQEQGRVCLAEFGDFYRDSAKILSFPRDYGRIRLELEDKSKYSGGDGFGSS